MSKLLISQYHNEVEKIIQYGGSRNESSIRGAFQNLLNEYCKLRDFLLIPELDYQTKLGNVVYPDGTVKDALRLDWGYWESKDKYDNLDEEIEKKLSKGYPDDNILFEDSQQAILIQGGEEKLRVSLQDVEGLDNVLNAFINYVRPEVKDFREAIDSFTEDLPTIVESLRDLIAKQSEENKGFIAARDKFLVICQESINPEISLLDVREMIIQHILTEDIFINIFNESQFHQENNIDRELQGVIETFFRGKTKRNTLGTIERYYAVIRRTAASIYNHQEKQKFLKSVYENFYKAYNPKAADRLGIVYTPNEIVSFMIESVDYLVHKHFGKLLSDSGVEILDPATGTGTFITELIEYLPKNKLKYKYQNEIHCNEVAILPYYIANLNIEYTYKQKMGEYEEFDHICFMDTLDNTSFTGKQLDLFAMTVENTQRIKDQNDRQISVIIGNPPYNANQQNENDNNKNRKYPAIDKRIKDTYVKESTAQKTKVYDPYARFIRWGTDRLGDNGILAFITNSSFINARTFDGFRKLATQEFSEIYIINLGGDVRSNSKLSGTTHNVFGIQAGVAISFMIKHQNNDKIPCKIFYISRPELETSEEKLRVIALSKFEDVKFNHIQPDQQNNWINLVDNDFDRLILLTSKKSQDSIFSSSNLGVSTNRDLWVYDLNKKCLIDKISYMIKTYNNLLSKNNKNFPDQIKWSQGLKKRFLSNKKIDFFEQKITYAYYRPFYKIFYYCDLVLSHALTELHFRTYGNNLKNNNTVINLTGPNSQKPFMVLANNHVSDLHFVGAAAASQCLPLYTYDENGNRIDNITDWGLEQIQNNYQDKNITKLDIFHYTYAVLHNPEYRKKYELNLKREFPRLPLYKNFFQWVEWGQKLMDLHINYETVELYSLTRIDIALKTENATPKPKLKADKTKGIITLDNITQLKDIPPLAWEYKLGNRCALEWILDQYKEKKPRDKTIAEKFNNYRFADYKETVIDLLQKVCTVSIETMKIIQQMNE